MVAKKKTPEKTITVTGYKFKGGARLPAKIAPAVGKRLAELTVSKGDGLVAEDLVEEARALESPLHGLFEWDESRAAAAYRLVQARHILGSITIEFIDSGGSSGEIRAYAVVTEQEAQHYVPIVRVMANPVLREQYLASAEQELAHFTSKYDGIKELFGVVVEAKKFLERRRRKIVR